MLMVDFVLFDNIRGALQVFDIPFVMTAGGPGYASSTFTLYTIKTAFTFSNFGLAATMAVAIMLMIVLIYVIQNKITERSQVENRKDAFGYDKESNTTNFKTDHMYRNGHYRAGTDTSDIVCLPEVQGSHDTVFSIDASCGK